MTETKKKSATKVLKKKMSNLETAVDERISECVDNLRVFQKKMRKLGKKKDEIAASLVSLEHSLEAVRVMVIEQRRKDRKEKDELSARIAKLETLIQGPMTIKIRSIERRVTQVEDHDRETKAQLATHSRTIRNYAAAIDN